jgi:hypothetical protein
LRSGIDGGFPLEKRLAVEVFGQHIAVVVGTTRDVVDAFGGKVLGYGNGAASFTARGE